ncbi:hypothetical protein cyc_03080 [Cyclospora cayetanensis]|uniref:AF4/FMR2 family member 4 n=1 Tax=Cyclospora cayetanensis TaxID=88456 RepID=A0A1D3CYD5_9EIME|nr:hypothetical protein cyc_03080 [Cyclospora cayetanensis]
MPEPEAEALKAAPRLAGAMSAASLSAPSLQQGTPQMAVCMYTGSPRVLPRLPSEFSLGRHLLQLRDTGRPPRRLPPQKVLLLQQVLLRSSSHRKRSRNEAPVSPVQASRPERHQSPSAIQDESEFIPLSLRDRTDPFSCRDSSRRSISPCSNTNSCSAACGPLAQERHPTQGPLGNAALLTTAAAGSPETASNIVTSALQSTSGTSALAATAASTPSTIQITSGTTAAALAATSSTAPTTQTTSAATAQAQISSGGTAAAAPTAPVPAEAAAPTPAASGVTATETHTAVHRPAATVEPQEYDELRSTACHCLHGLQGHHGTPTVSDGEALEEAAGKAKSAVVGVDAAAAFTIVTEATPLVNPAARVVGVQTAAVGVNANTPIAPLVPAAIPTLAACSYRPPRSSRAVLLFPICCGKSVPLSESSNTGEMLPDCIPQRGGVGDQSGLFDAFAPADSHAAASCAAATLAGNRSASKSPKCPVAAGEEAGPAPCSIPVCRLAVASYAVSAAAMHVRTPIAETRRRAAPAERRPKTATANCAAVRGVVPQQDAPLFLQYCPLQTRKEDVKGPNDGICTDGKPGGSWKSPLQAATASKALLQQGRREHRKGVQTGTNFRMPAEMATSLPPEAAVAKRAFSSAAQRVPKPKEKRSGVWLLPRIDEGSVALRSSTLLMASGGAAYASRRVAEECIKESKIRAATTSGAAHLDDDSVNPHSAHLTSQPPSTDVSARQGLSVATADVGTSETSGLLKRSIHTLPCWVSLLQRLQRHAAKHAPAEQMLLQEALAAITQVRKALVQQLPPEMQEHPKVTIRSKGLVLKSRRLQRAGNSYYSGHSARIIRHAAPESACAGPPTEEATSDGSREAAAQQRSLPACSPLSMNAARCQNQRRQHKQHQQWRGKSEHHQQQRHATPEGPQKAPRKAGKGCSRKAAAASSATPSTANPEQSKWINGYCTATPSTPKVVKKAIDGAPDLAGASTSKATQGAATTWRGDVSQLPSHATIIKAADADVRSQQLRRLLPRSLGADSETALSYRCKKRSRRYQSVPTPRRTAGSSGTGSSSGCTILAVEQNTTLASLTRQQRPVSARTRDQGVAAKRQEKYEETLATMRAQLQQLQKQQMQLQSQLQPPWNSNTAIAAATATVTARQQPLHTAAKLPAATVAAISARQTWKGGLATHHEQEVLQKLQEHSLRQQQHRHSRQQALSLTTGRRAQEAPAKAVVEDASSIQDSSTNERECQRDVQNDLHQGDPLKQGNTEEAAKHRALVVPPRGEAPPEPQEQQQQICCTPCSFKEGSQASGTPNPSHQCEKVQHQEGVLPGHQLQMLVMQNRQLRRQLHEQQKRLQAQLQQPRTQPLGSRYRSRCGSVKRSPACLRSAGPQHQLQKGAVKSAAVECACNTALKPDSSPKASASSARPCGVSIGSIILSEGACGGLSATDSQTHTVQAEGLEPRVDAAKRAQLSDTTEKEADMLGPTGPTATAAAILKVAAESSSTRLSLSQKVKDAGLEGEETATSFHEPCTRESFSPNQRHLRQQQSLADYRSDTQQIFLAASEGSTRQGPPLPLPLDSAHLCSTADNRYSLIKTQNLLPRRSISNDENSTPLLLQLRRLHGGDAAQRCEQEYKKSTSTYLDRLRDLQEQRIAALLQLRLQQPQPELTYHGWLQNCGGLERCRTTQSVQVGCSESITNRAIEQDQRQPQMQQQQFRDLDEPPQHPMEPCDSYGACSDRALLQQKQQQGHIHESRRGKCPISSGYLKREISPTAASKTQLLAGRGRTDLVLSAARDEAAAGAAVSTTGDITKGAKGEFSRTELGGKEYYEQQPKLQETLQQFEQQLQRLQQEMHPKQRAQQKEQRQQQQIHLIVGVRRSRASREAQLSKAPAVVVRKQPSLQQQQILPQNGPILQLHQTPERQRPLPTLAYEARQQHQEASGAAGQQSLELRSTKPPPLQGTPASILVPPRPIRALPQKHQRQPTPTQQPPKGSPPMESARNGLRAQHRRIKFAQQQIMEASKVSSSTEEQRQHITLHVCPVTARQEQQMQHVHVIRHRMQQTKRSEFHEDEGRAYTASKGATLVCRRSLISGVLEALVPLPAACAAGVLSGEEHRSASSDRLSQQIPGARCSCRIEAHSELVLKSSIASVHGDPRKIDTVCTSFAPKAKVAPTGDTTFLQGQQPRHQDLNRTQRSLMGASLSSEERKLQASLQLLSCQRQAEEEDALEQRQRLWRCVATSLLRYFGETRQCNWSDVRCVESLLWVGEWLAEDGPQLVDALLKALELQILKQQPILQVCSRMAPCSAVAVGAEGEDQRRQQGRPPPPNVDESAAALTAVSFCCAVRVYLQQLALTKAMAVFLLRLGWQVPLHLEEQKQMQQQFKATKSEKHQLMQLHAICAVWRDRWITRDLLHEMIDFCQQMQTQQDAPLGEKFVLQKAECASAACYIPVHAGENSNAIAAVSETGEITRFAQSVRLPCWDVSAPSPVEAATEQHTDSSSNSSDQSVPQPAFSGRAAKEEQRMSAPAVPRISAAAQSAENYGLSAPPIRAEARSVFFHANTASDEAAVAAAAAPGVQACVSLQKLVAAAEGDVVASLLQVCCWCLGEKQHNPIPLLLRSLSVCSSSSTLGLLVDLTQSSTRACRLRVSRQHDEDGDGWSEVPEGVVEQQQQQPSRMLIEDDTEVTVAEAESVIEGFAGVVAAAGNTSLFAHSSEQQHECQTEEALLVNLLALLSEPSDSDCGGSTSGIAHTILQLLHVLPQSVLMQLQQAAFFETLRSKHSSGSTEINRANSTNDLGSALCSVLRGSVFTDAAQGASVLSGWECISSCSSGTSTGKLRRHNDCGDTPLNWRFFAEMVQSALRQQQGLNSESSTYRSAVLALLVTQWRDVRLLRGLCGGVYVELQQEHWRALLLLHMQQRQQEQQHNQQQQQQQRKALPHYQRFLQLPPGVCSNPQERQELVPTACGTHTPELRPAALQQLLRRLKMLQRMQRRRALTEGATPCSGRNFRGDCCEEWNWESAMQQVLLHSGRATTAPLPLVRLLLLWQRLLQCYPLALQLARNPHSGSGSSSFPFCSTRGDSCPQNEGLDARFRALSVESSGNGERLAPGAPTAAALAAPAYAAEGLEVALALLQQGGALPAAPKATTETAVAAAVGPSESAGRRGCTTLDNSSRYSTSSRSSSIDRGKGLLPSTGLPTKEFLEKLEQGRQPARRQQQQHQKQPTDSLPSLLSTSASTAYEGPASADTFGQPIQELGRWQLPCRGLRVYLQLLRVARFALLPAPLVRLFLCETSLSLSSVENPRAYGGRRGPVALASLLAFCAAGGKVQTPQLVWSTELQQQVLLQLCEPIAQLLQREGGSNSNSGPATDALGFAAALGVLSVHLVRPGESGAMATPAAVASAVDNRLNRKAAGVGAAILKGMQNCALVRVWQPQLARLLTAGGMIVPVLLYKADRIWTSGFHQMQLLQQQPQDLKHLTRREGLCARHTLEQQQFQMRLQLCRLQDESEGLLRGSAASEASESETAVPTTLASAAEATLRIWIRTTEQNQFTVLRELMLLPIPQRAAPCLQHSCWRAPKQHRQHSQQPRPVTLLLQLLRCFHVHFHKHIHEESGEAGAWTASTSSSNSTACESANTAPCCSEQPHTAHDLLQLLRLQQLLLLLLPSMFAQCTCSENTVDAATAVSATARNCCCVCLSHQQLLQQIETVVGNNERVDRVLLLQSVMLLHVLLILALAQAAVLPTRAVGSDAPSPDAITEASTMTIDASEGQQQLTQRQRGQWKEEQPVQHEEHQSSRRILDSRRRRVGGKEEAQTKSRKSVSPYDLAASQCMYAAASDAVYSLASLQLLLSAGKEGTSVGLTAMEEELSEHLEDAEEQRENTRFEGLSADAVYPTTPETASAAAVVRRMGIRMLLAETVAAFIGIAPRSNEFTAVDASLALLTTSAAAPAATITEAASAATLAGGVNKNDQRASTPSVWLPGYSLHWDLPDREASVHHDHRIFVEPSLPSPCVGLLLSLRVTLWLSRMVLLQATAALSQLLTPALLLQLLPQWRHCSACSHLRLQRLCLTGSMDSSKSCCHSLAASAAAADVEKLSSVCVADGSSDSHEQKQLATKTAAAGASEWTPAATCTTRQLQHFLKLLGGSSDSATCFWNVQERRALHSVTVARAAVAGASKAAAPLVLGALIEAAARALDKASTGEISLLLVLLLQALLDSAITSALSRALEIYRKSSLDAHVLGGRQFLEALAFSVSLAVRCIGSEWLLEEANCGVVWIPEQQQPATLESADADTSVAGCPCFCESTTAYKIPSTTSRLSLLHLLPLLAALLQPEEASATATAEATASSELTGAVVAEEAFSVLQRSVCSTGVGLVLLLHLLRAGEAAGKSVRETSNEGCCCS